MPMPPRMWSSASPPALEGWQNSTSLEASASWGGGFCTAHHVGWFCQGFTRVRCCRNTWGFVQCGTTAHHRGCGWGGAGWHGAGWHAGWHHWSEAPEAEGPYLEEPADADAEQPKP